MPKTKNEDEIVAQALEANEKLASERSVWNTQFQLVAEYFLQRKATFTIEEEQGAFINSEVWTDVPAKTAETAASALLGLVWPDNKSFSLQPAEGFEDDEDIKTWLEDATKVLSDSMNNPEAGLALALEEFMIDYLVLGTPAMHTEEGDKSDLRFDAWNVANFHVDEGASGAIDTFYKNYKYTVRQAVERFGLKNLSAKTQKLYQSKQFGEKIKMLHVIKPRNVIPDGGEGAHNMPIASLHIEVEARKLVKESGYHELPTFAARYSKRIGEKYGRSAAMRALPTTIELNALWEMVTLGIEKNYDPPLAMYSDGAMGNGTIDTSAGSISVFNVSSLGNLNRAPIEPMFTVGSLSEPVVLIERLENTISDHFMIDILLDLNNEKEMTAREFLGRQALRQRAIRSPISRLTTELLNPLIERCFNILLRKGRFGYAENSPEYQAAQAANPDEEIKTIPEAVVNMQGNEKPLYRVDYMTPAARQQKAEEAQGIMNWYEFIGNVAQFDQSILDVPNNERSEKILGDIWSVPQGCRNTEDELKEIRDARNSQAEQQQELADAQQAAGIAKDVSQIQQ